VAVGNQDQRGIARTMATDACRRRHQRRHLLVRQVFPAAVGDVRPAQGNFPLFDGWQIAAVGRGSRMGAHGEIKTFDIWNILGKVILG
jgi:hypothetical protein